MSVNMDDGNDRVSSSASSPIPPEPFEPKAVVNFSDDISKDGDTVYFTILVKKNNQEGESSDEGHSIKRQYEDFEWLEHCLTTSNNVSGVIIPPLPLKPATDPSGTEARSRKQLGASTPGMIGDEFYKTSVQLEKYLNLLLSHEIFGNDQQLMDFLWKNEAPPRAKLKKGILSRLNESMESRKSTHPDCDEFFQKERVWVASYLNAIKETSDKFNTIIFTYQRVCNQLAHLATAFSLCIGSSDPSNIIYNKLNIRYSECIDSYRKGLEKYYLGQESTLGLHLDLYRCYIESESQMLLRRTCLLIDYENANRNMDRAKPTKKELAEKYKHEAEQAYEECSDVARREIKKFQRLRTKEFKDALVAYASSQLTAAQGTRSLLIQSLDKFKQFSIAI